jgi:15-cis-phytoene synthase
VDTYSETAYTASKNLTRAYSTSFSWASRLFDKRIEQHIYAIYGLVRVADEIVDEYRGADAKKLLDALEQEIYAAIDRGYSTNIIIHSFALTARKYAFPKTLLTSFFSSMRTDLHSPLHFTTEQ